MCVWGGGDWDEFSGGCCSLSHHEPLACHALSSGESSNGERASNGGRLSIGAHRQLIKCRLLQHQCDWSPTVACSLRAHSNTSVKSATNLCKQFLTE